MYKNKDIKFWSLVFTLAKRDLRIKYVQTYFGFVWITVQPILGYLLISFFFGKLLKVSKDIPDYPIFAYCGMMGWYYFSNIAGFSGISLIQNQDMVQKTNIPKLALPVSKAFSGLFEFFIWIIILFIIMSFSGNYPNFHLIILPFFILLNLIAGLSIGLWVSAFTIKYRDFYHLIPYVVGITIFITPVLYPVGMVPDNLKFIVYLNPMSGVIEGYRWIFLKTGLPIIQYLWGFGALIIFFILGLINFKSVEKKMADII